MYDPKFLLDTLDLIIESAQHRLNDLELELLREIRNHIADNKDDKKIEEGFLELVKWLLVIIEFLKNTS